MNTSVPTHPPHWLRDRLLAWEILAIGLAVTLVAWTLASRQLAREARGRFDAEASRLTLALKSELDDSLLALDASRGLFDVPREVDHPTWTAFVKHLDVEKRFPGMRGMGFARAVHRKDPPAPGPMPGRDEAFPNLSILFLEPELPGFREAVLGVDLLFEPIRLEAGLRAVQSGKVAVSAPVVLRSSPFRGVENHPAVVFYLPVYEGKEPQISPGDRSRQLRGMVFASFFTDALLGHVFAKASDIEVKVEDSLAMWQGQPLFDSTAGKPAPKRREWRFEQTTAVEVGQRTWRVSYRSAPSFALGLREWGPAAVLIGGLVVSAILFGFTRAQMQGRARAEALAAALRESDDHFRSLADTAACVIVLYSDVIEYVNDFACVLLGYPREELLGKPLWQSVHPADQPLVQAFAAARLRGEAVPKRYELRLLGKNGEERWVDATSGKLNWGGKALGLATAFDITDRVKAVEERLQLERKLLEAQRLESLGLLAGGIAHDFNNLLGAILGHASLVEDELPEQSPARHSLERIRSTTQQAAELSRQMLAYSGRGTLVVEKLDLSQHVKAINSLLEVSIPKKARIEVELAAELPPIKADAGQLHQVIMILVTNAAEAIPGTGRIQLQTRMAWLDAAQLRRLAPDRGLQPGPFVCLEVQDDGKGMDEATQARIFDPFFTTKFTGRGLGLAALQGIVLGHGGFIEVESRPGSGSRFRVYFPPCAGSDPGPPDTGPVDIPKLPKRGTRILIAEDEMALLEATTEVLGRAGYEVVAAADGGQAVACFEQDPDGFALAILDLTMPVLDGRECFKRIRALRPDFKVILASGYGGSEAGSKFEEGELAGFLQKPYRSRELVAAVQKVLGG